MAGSGGARQLCPTLKDLLSAAVTLRRATARHAGVQRRQALQEGLLAGPEDPAAGQGGVEAALQAALYGEQGIWRRALL